MIALTVICWERECVEETCSLLEYLNTQFKLIQKPAEVNEILSTGSRLIITDMLLPKKPGFIVCKEIKEIKPDLKVALLIPPTADAEEIKKRWGADYTISRPPQWREIADLLKSEGIPFTYPVEEGEGAPNEIIQIFLDLLLSNKKCTLEIEGEVEKASLKIYEGWTELDEAKKLIEMMNEESLKFRSYPLKEMLNEGKLVHLSQIIKSCVNELRKKIFMPLNTVRKIKPVENMKIPEYLSPAERVFVKRIKEEGELRLTASESYGNWEKEKFEEMLYYLTVLNIITMEYEFQGEKREEIEETAQAERIVERPSSILPPEEEAEEEPALPSSKEVVVEPPEELELIRKYAEEKYKKMSLYEKLEEGEILLEEMLPPVKKSQPSSEEQIVKIDEKSVSEKRLEKVGYEQEKFEEEKILHEILAPVEKPVEEPFKKPIAKPEKTVKKNALLWSIITAGAIIAGVVIAVLLLTKTKVSISGEMTKAEKILHISSSDELKKLLGNLRHPTIRMLTTAIAYDAGLTKDIPEKIPSPENDIENTYNLYINFLTGEDVAPQNIKALNYPIMKFIYARVLISKDPKGGKNLMNEIGGVLPLIFSIRFACEHTERNELKETLKTKNDVWIKDAIECAWKKMDYNTLLEIYNSHPFNEPEIKTWAGIAYFKTGRRDEGEKLLLEAGTDTAYYILGEEMEKDGKTKEAVKYYSMVKGGVYLEKAKKRIEEITKEERKEKPEVNIPELLAMGISARKEGKSETAKEYFIKVLKHQPSNPDANYHIGMIYLEEGNFPLAKKYLNQFLISTSTEDKRIEEVKNILKYIP